MSAVSVRDAIRSRVAQEAQVPSDDPMFTDDANLFDEGYLDSVQFVALVAWIESSFSIKLDESALFSEEFTTIAGISGLVEETRRRDNPEAAA